MKFLFFLALLALFLNAGRWVEFDRGSIDTLLAAFPVWAGPVVFAVLYAVLTFFIWFAVKDILRVSSALLFGGPLSAVVVWSGEMISAVLHFILARRLGRGFVRQKPKGKSRAMESLSHDTRAFNILTLRINPLVPFRALDLAAGLTSVSLPKYLLTISLVSFLRIYWGQSILAVAGDTLLKDPMAAIKLIGQRMDVWHLSIVYFGAIALLTLLASLRSARDLRRGRVASGPKADHAS